MSTVQPMQTDFSPYKRQCLRVLDSYGIAVDDPPWRTRSANVIGHMFETEQDQYKAWLAESLLFAFQALERGDRILAFRGYAQAQEYIGRLTYTPIMFDGGPSTLRDALEEVISRAA